MIHELIAAQAERHPDRIAVADQDGSLSYAELDERADRLAHLLREAGAGPGRLVAVALGRSRDAIVAILGTLKAGGGYLPVDSPAAAGESGPSSRLALMLEDAAPVALVTHTALLDQPPSLADRPILRLDDAELLAAAPAGPLPVVASPDDTAYAIYTSGSTGRPKAVLVPHRAAVNLWSALCSEVYAACPAGPLRVSVNAPLSFDASVQQLLALLDGHTLVIVPGGIRANGRALLDFIERNSLDVWDCTPAQLRLLVAAGLLGADRERPGLILCGGEAFDESTWQALAGSTRPTVFNMYGPTECTVDSTLARVGGSRPTIGHPISGAQLYIVDERLKPLSDGEPGELCIAGAGVADGYLNRPELTAERFVTNPFDPAGGRMYRTGDLARRRPDGEIEFLGRTDDQVKLRGYRIELGEVAAALARVAGVSEAVVSIHPGDGGEPRLIGHYVSSAGAHPTDSDLRASLGRWLPPHMIPSAFVAIESIPLTPSGKLDRWALPPPLRSRPDLQSAFVAPGDQLERNLAAIWEQVLNLDPGTVGVRDDFFDDFGGDSIRAVQLVDAIESLTGSDLTVDFALTAPTISEQAVVLADAPER